MKLIIAGSRDFTNYSLLERTLDSFLEGKFITTILSGCARGADKLGEQYGNERLGLQLRQRCFKKEQ